MSLRSALCEACTCSCTQYGVPLQRNTTTTYKLYLEAASCASLCLVPHGHAPHVKSQDARARPRTQLAVHSRTHSPAHTSQRGPRRAALQVQQEPLAVADAHTDLFEDGPQVGWALCGGRRCDAAVGGWLPGGYRAMGRGGRGGAASAGMRRGRNGRGGGRGSSTPRQPRASRSAWTSR